MDELLDLKDRLNKQKKKFIKKLFIIENQLLEIEKEFAKLNETQLVESLSLSEMEEKAAQLARFLRVPIEGI